MIRFLVSLGRGFRGHPAHPPFTDFTVGAYTVTAVCAIFGLLGVAEDRMAVLSVVSVTIGLVSSALTILTGLLDYVRIARGTPLRRTAAVHWVSMAIASAGFVVAAALLEPAYDSHTMPVGGALVTIGSWLLLLFGSWVGGSIVFVYGMRVLGERDTPTADSLKPHFPPD